MSNFTLETLPPDVITQILESFSEFHDLRALITSCAVFYRYFDRYSSSILTQVAKGVVGLDSWKESSTVLIYQRKANRNDTRKIPENTNTGFVMQREDIPHLVANQKFFRSCASEFVAYLHDYHPRVRASNEDKGESFKTMVIANSSLYSSTFAAGDTLSSKYFYQMLAIQFGNDTIETFARRGSLSMVQLVDLNLLARVIIRCADYKNFITKPMWGHLLRGLTVKETLFSICVSFDIRDWNSERIENNSLLFMKTIHHLYVSIEEQYPFQYDSGDDLLAAFMEDYPRKNVEYLIKTYKLPRGMDMVDGSFSEEP